jgi:hypothetical protein
MRTRSDEGAGAIATLGGLAVVLMLMFMAVNVLTYLYTTSTVTAVAFDAARRAAGAQDPDGGGRVAATTTARGLLGSIGVDTTFDWSKSNAEQVRLTVDAPGVRLLPQTVLRQMGIDRIRRTAVVKVERFQPSVPR